MTNTFTWKTATPESQRLDADKLEAMGGALAQRGTQALLVIRHDRIVYEWYAPGHGPSQRHYTASLAKALVGGMSLLLALAGPDSSHKGQIGVDDLACTYIPAWREDPQKSKITIRHLATHTSGIENAELSDADHAQARAEGRTVSANHMELPGWKGAFWRKDPDPFSIAIHQAPVIFPPGTQYAYSNPGMAALAYAVTASLQEGTPYPDIRTLLKAQVMDPIGVPDDAWSIGYGRAYEMDGLKLYANWGGGEYTARAVARVGRLMLRGGNWEGQQLIDATWVKKMLTYAGMPLPDRPPGNPQPGSGLCWWTNFDGVWPSLPRDAFAGAGAGNQILLVVPCRDLIVVRNGALIGDPAQGEGFWGGAERYLFTPLMDAFLPHLPSDAAEAPTPPSEVIKEVTFAPPSTIVRQAFDSDNWPMTWGDDDHQYTAYGDGHGFKPFIEQKLGLGFAKIIGEPPDAPHAILQPSDIQGINIRSASGENLRYGPHGAKASGLLMVNGLLYMWARNTDNAQLAWSRDHAQTWTWADWTFTTSFGYPTFLNFGPNYTGARDEYVYVYSHDADSAYQAADCMVLARVPQDAIIERDAYEFFSHLDDGGQPGWTQDIAQRGPVFTHPGYCRRSGISYNAGLGRYLWWQQFAEESADTRFEGGFGIYDAPEPWGPWTTVYFTKAWDTGPGETGCLPTKWISGDGKTGYLVFSGNDYFSVRKVTFTLQSKYKESSS